MTMNQSDTKTPTIPHLLWIYLSIKGAKQVYRSISMSWYEKEGGVSFMKGEGMLDQSKDSNLQEDTLRPSSIHKQFISLPSFSGSTSKFLLIHDLNKQTNKKRNNQAVRSGDGHLSW
uniref:Uncharacterized protein n=1 Tax=Anguilla anguilla TaxID=7936 RepID=A0A0E9WJA2_ANGAN